MFVVLWLSSAVITETPGILFVSFALMNVMVSLSLPRNSRHCFV